MPTRRTLVCTLSLMSLPLALAAAQESIVSLRGTVTDSVRHGPLAGATVIASPVAAAGADVFRDYMASTDARGQFAMTSLRPGIYMLTVEHPWLDSSGLGVPARQVDLTRERAATIDLAVPSGATIRAAICPGAAHDSSTGLVAGYVKDARSDHPVAGARIVFAWSDFDVDRRTARTTPLERTAATSTSRDGTFRMCGLPVFRTILMQAQSPHRGATGAIEVQLPTSGVLVETFRLDTSAAGTTSLTGEVRREGSRRAIAGAHVHLFGAADDLLSAADGSFHMIEVPVGTQSIEVTALGYYPRRYALDLLSGNTGHVTISMAEMGTVLDSVRILSREAELPALHQEFDARSTHGPGQYLTEAMIAKAHPLETAELLQQVRGFYVMSDTVYSSRGVTRLQQGAGRACMPVLYVNGIVGVHTMNDISPDTIYGVEIYTSASIMPPQYPAALCGAIFIWTK